MSSHLTVSCKRLIHKKEKKRLISVISSGVRQTLYSMFLIHKKEPARKSQSFRTQTTHFVLYVFDSRKKNQLTRGIHSEVELHQLHCMFLIH